MNIYKCYASMYTDPISLKGRDTHEKFNRKSNQCAGRSHSIRPSNLGGLE